MIFFATHLILFEFFANYTYFLERKYNLIKLSVLLTLNLLYFIYLHI